MVMGRYQGVAEGTFLLSGQDAAGRRWSEAVTGRVSKNAALAPAWARAYLRELEDAFAIGRGDTAKLERQIVEVSLKFGVLCRFTSFVAVDRSEVVNKGGQQHQIIQPVDMSAGWAGEDDIAATFDCRAFRAPPPACASAPPPEVETVTSCLMEFSDADIDDSAMTLGPPAADAPSGIDLGNAEQDGEAAKPRPPMPATPPPKSAPPPPPASGWGTAIRKGSKQRRSNRSPGGGTGGAEEQSGCVARAGASNRSPGGGTGGADQSRKTSGDARGGGLLRRMVDAVFGRKKKKDAAPPATAPPSSAKQSAPEPDDHLAAYRQRARDMLEQLTAAASLDASQRLHELGVLSLKLGALVEDLKSVGAGEVVLPLEGFRDELQQFLMAERLDEAMLALVWAKAEAVLKAFAEGTPPEPAAGRREQFWK
jgi:Ca-activated chloride channel family protein